MRVAHEEDLIGVYIAVEQELLNEIAHEGIDIDIIKPIPGIVRGAQGEILIAANFGMLFVVNLHHLPLAVVHFFRRAATAVHGNEKRPASGGAGANSL